jgi:hypothetical protein
MQMHAKLRRYGAVNAIAIIMMVHDVVNCQPEGYKIADGKAYGGDSESNCERSLAAVDELSGTVPEWRLGRGRIVASR